ncbi:MAG: hypothetical protein R3F30_02520 [Planctomycetota bacterium]
MVRFQVVEAVKGRIEWEVPARFCNGQSVVWYIVQGLDDKERLAEFWKDPGSWRWGRVQFFLQHVGRNGGGTSWVHPEGRVLGSGRLVDSRRSVPDNLSFELEATNAQLEQRGKIFRSHAQCIPIVDPWSGRYWIQSPWPTGSCAWIRVRSAGRFPDRPAETSGEWIELGTDEAEVIRLQPLAGLRIPVTGKDPLLLWEMKGRLDSWEQHLASGSVVPIQVDGGTWLWIDGISQGKHQVLLGVEGENSPLWTSEPVSLEKGMVKTLEQGLDLDRVIWKVRVEVKDDRGAALKGAVVYRITHFDENGKGAGHRGGAVDDEGAASLPVTSRGGRLVVLAEGFEPGILGGVKEDLVVRLRRLPVGAATLDVVLQGLPREAGMLDDLWVRMEPVEGIPDWAAYVLASSNKLRKAAVDKDGRASFARLPLGKVRLRLAYGKERYWVAVRDKDGFEVEVVEGGRQALMPVPEKALRQAHEQWARHVRFVDDRNRRIPPQRR